MLHTKLRGHWPLGSGEDFYHIRPRGYKTFFMLNSAEHENSN